MKHCHLRELTARNLPAGKYADGQGLWLMKRDRQRGKWIFRFTLYTRAREMGLGPWPDVGLSEARDRAAEARKLCREQKDPILERKKVRRAQTPLTFKQAAEGCFEARRAELKRDGEAGRWMSPLKHHVIPKIGNYPVAEIDQHLLKETLRPIWHAKAETAEKALNRINLVLKHAAALGLPVDLQATMKARALLGAQRHTTEHIPALPYEDAPDFYRWLCTQGGTSALALRFLMLTLARTSEVRLATRSEFEPTTWTIPPARTKQAREHRVPLTTEAQAVTAIARERSPNEYLFPA